MVEELTYLLNLTGYSWEERKGAYVTQPFLTEREAKTFAKSMEYAGCCAL